MEKRSTSGQQADAHTTCTYCIGLSIYTKAMLFKGETPTCHGLELDRQNRPRVAVQRLKDSCAPPPNDDFVFVSLGMTVYSRDWMIEGRHLPATVGLSGVGIKVEDPEERMKRLEERKRIKRELDAEHDDYYDYEDDDTEDDSGPFLEKDVVPAVPKPEFPPRVPAFTFDNLIKKTSENAQRSAEAMYNFWARRLEGFADRYVASCQRIVHQMEKQVTSVPKNCKWLLNEIQERTFGKGGGRE